MDQPNIRNIDGCGCGCCREGRIGDVEGLLLGGSGSGGGVGVGIWYLCRRVVVGYWLGSVGYADRGNEGIGWCCGMIYKG